MTICRALFFLLPHLHLMAACGDGFESGIVGKKWHRSGMNRRWVGAPFLTPGTLLTYVCSCPGTALGSHAQRCALIFFPFLVYDLGFQAWVQKGSHPSKQVMNGRVNVVKTTSSPLVYAKNPTKSSVLFLVILTCTMNVVWLRERAERLR